MISSYRLGDLILLNLQPHEQEESLKDNPDSFGSKYILETRKNNNCNNIDIITKIVLEYIDQNMVLKLLLKKNIRKTYVIGKSFFASTSSTNYEECITLSNKYLID